MTSIKPSTIARVILGILLLIGMGVFGTLHGSLFVLLINGIAVVLAVIILLFVAAFGAFDKPPQGRQQ